MYHNHNDINNDVNDNANNNPDNYNHHNLETIF